jgi:hypothetical protein
MTEPGHGYLRQVTLELLPLALETTQHGVDETRRGAMPKQRGRIDRGRDCGVGRYAQLLQLQQPESQQRSKLRLLRVERPREQPCGLPLEAVMPAQSAEHQRSEQRLIAVRHRWRHCQRFVG